METKISGALATESTLRSIAGLVTVPYYRIVRTLPDANNEQFDFYGSDLVTIVATMTITYSDAFYSNLSEVNVTYP